VVITEKLTLTKNLKSSMISLFVKLDISEAFDSVVGCFYWKCCKLWALDNDVVTYQVLEGVKISKNI
jgi:hypothetical protein